MYLIDKSLSSECYLFVLFDNLNQFVIHLVMSIVSDMYTISPGYQNFALVGHDKWLFFMKAIPLSVEVFF